VKKAFVLFLFSLIVTLPTFAQEAPVLEENLTEECVAEYDPNVDYFPNKVEVEFADGLQVEYFNNYKVVRATTPWPGATEADVFEYVLVQCGTPAPDGFDGAQVIEVPSGDIIALSSTQLPHLLELGLLDHLIGIEDKTYITNEEVRASVDAGDVIEVGGGSAINIELVLDAEPDLVMTYSAGLPEYDSHPILLGAGLNVAMNNEWVESSPLGRAEWIKFTSLFYNKEAEANEVFDARVAEYQELAALAAGLPEEEKPAVLYNAFSSYSEAWDIPGSNSYMAQLLNDAGGHIILGDAPEAQGQAGSVPFDFETVYEVGQEADLWIVADGGTSTLDELFAQDERYADFAPVDAGTVWNNNAKINEDGGNAFWEQGVTHPEVLLADLIAILHPDLLPDYTPTFYKQVQ
jgi:iron complex transport system substrate-binding protein